LRRFPTMRREAQATACKDSRCTKFLGVGLAARFVFAAGCGAIRFVYENVIVAGGADYAVDRFAELIVGRTCGVFAARLFTADRHDVGSELLTATF
jgi:hypothetical protein